MLPAPDAIFLWIFSSAGLTCWAYGSAILNGNDLMTSAIRTSLDEVYFFGRMYMFGFSGCLTFCPCRLPYSSLTASLTSFWMKYSTTMAFTGGPD